MEPCGITRLCVRIVSVNVQESASLESVSNRSPSQRMWQSSKISTRMRSSQFIRLLRRQLSHSRSSASRMCRCLSGSAAVRPEESVPSVRRFRQNIRGAYGVVVNAPIADEVITEIKQVVDIPVIATIASVHTDVRRKLEAGADILNVSGAAATASMVAEIRKEYPDVAIIATGGPTNESILGDDRGRSQCDHVHAAVQRRAVCADDEEIQGDQSLIIQKTGPKRKHNFLFGSGFILCGKIYNSSGTMQNIQFRKYSLQIGTICHIFPDFFSLSPTF